MPEISPAKDRDPDSGSTLGLDLLQWQDVYLVFASSTVNGSLTVAIMKTAIAIAIHFARNLRTAQSGPAAYPPAPQDPCLSASC